MAPVASAAAAGRGATEQGSVNLEAFRRPIAHRGLHGRRGGRIENTVPAFEAAIARGYGIECDLQAARDGTPMVFHDEMLDRLVAATGPIAAHTPASLSRMRYRRHDTSIITYAALLDLVAGRVPLLVEVKRNKQPPPRGFLEKIAAQAEGYAGPMALMSFDPDIVAALGRIAPGIPRGWIVGSHQLPARWWAAPAGARKDAAVARLLATAPEGISFLSVDVRLVRSARAWVGADARELGLFCWTVRTKRQRATAARWSDAPTFEGYEP